MKTYDELEIKHQIAVDLKLEGLRYKQIAVQVQVKEQTVAEWFQIKGICYKAFQQKKQARAKERTERFIQIDDQLKEMAGDAVIALKNALGKNSVSAAFGVLDRAGFQPIRQVQEESKPKEVVVTYVYPENEPVKMEITPEP